MEHEAHVPSFIEAQQLNATDVARLNAETKEGQGQFHG